ncbi:MAG: hypothetical protein ABH983_01455 [Candidatus Micrarchaeota archaeon]
MDIKIVLLLVLGVSFLFFGCASKKANPNEGVKYDEIESTEPDDSVTSPPAEEEVSDDDSTYVEAETEADDSDEGTVEHEEEFEADEETEDLADLFVIDTDKPLEGEGLDVKSPEQE